MSWTPVGVGTRATGGATLTTILNASTLPGDLILLFEREANVANTVPAVSGYTGLATTDQYMKIYGKYAGSSEPNPAANFSNGYFNCFTWRWAGGTAPAIGSIVDSGTPAPANASQVNIPFSACTPATNNCAIVAFGSDILGATNTATIADPAAFPNSIDRITGIMTGSSCGIICDYVIQTTATLISAGTWTVTGGASATVHGVVLALKAGTTSSGSNLSQMMMGMD